MRRVLGCHSDSGRGAYGKAEWQQIPPTAKQVLARGMAPRRIARHIGRWPRSVRWRDTSTFAESRASLSAIVSLASQTFALWVASGLGHTTQQRLAIIPTQ